MTRNTRRGEGPPSGITYSADVASIDDVDLEGAEEQRLVRFYFALPEPIGVADGFGHVDQVSNGVGDAREDDPWVDLIFHQVNSQFGRTKGAFDAVAQVVDRDSALRSKKRRGRRSTATASGFDTAYTIVEALTTSESPDEATEGTRPEFYTPRADAFARCLRLTSNVVRALRHAGDETYGLPTYPRIPVLVLHWTGSGYVTFQSSEGRRFRRIAMTEPWSGPQVMMLDHANLPDPGVNLEEWHEVGVRARHWLHELSRGNPLVLSRERFLEARRAREVLGEYGQAVTLANTAAETLLDVILVLLLWEEGVPAAEAARRIQEGKVLRRVRTEFPPRLGGDWSTERGPVGAWVNDAYRLRHRVVHAGYLPTPEETVQAMVAVEALQRFVMDRLAERRNQYRRSVLMTVAEPGLRSRGMWSGEIRRFAEGDAQVEPNWNADFTAYHRRVVAAQAP